jgi:hypothetical protein
LIKWAIIGAPLKGDKLCNDVRDIGERHAMSWPVAQKRFDILLYQQPVPI